MVVFQYLHQLLMVFDRDGGALDDVHVPDSIGLILDLHLLTLLNVRALRHLRQDDFSGIV